MPESRACATVRLDGAEVAQVDALFGRWADGDEVWLGVEGWRGGHPHDGVDDSRIELGAGVVVSSASAAETDIASR